MFSKSAIEIYVDGVHAMTTRWRSANHFRAAIALLLTLLVGTPSFADIFRWDNGQLIPGTEGVTPGPGVQLDHHELAYAELSYRDLSNSRFEFSDLSDAIVDASTLTNASLRGANLANASLNTSTLTNADLSGANLANANLNHSLLTNASLRGVNLANAYLYSSTLTNADLGGAVVTGAYFFATTSHGFTKEQLYSTASHEAKNLSGIGLGQNDLSNWDFHGQNLAGASLDSSTLTNADLSGAVVMGANFQRTTSQGFTKEQLYLTASYRAKNLPGIWLNFNDLSGWDFNGQNLASAYLYNSTLTDANLSAAKLANADLNYSSLTNANLSGANLAYALLSGSTLTNANLSGAVVTGAFFVDNTSRGFTKEQLYSTLSYEQKNLNGIGLVEDDLSGWNFSGQNLANAYLGGSTLTDANLRGAVITGACFVDNTSRGFTKEQLYSTLSYEQKNLNGIGLVDDDLSGWNFSGQDMANASLGGSTLTNANLAAADMRGTQGLDLTGATSHNAILPDGTIAGLNLAAGDQLVVRNYHEDPYRRLGPIPITVQDHLTMGNGGVLQMLFDADPWDSLILFEPGIPVTLDGALELEFAEGVVAAEQAGRTIVIFDWSNVSPTGAFNVDSRYLWDVSNLYASGEVSLVSALTGDTDGDGQVGLNDLNNVRNQFGATGAQGLPGDAIPFDGVVDLGDLNAVRNNFGALAPQAVPEPGGLFLSAGGVLGLFVFRCRRGGFVRHAVGVLQLISSTIPGVTAPGY